TLGRVEGRGDIGPQGEEVGPAAGGERIVVEMGVGDGIEDPRRGEIQELPPGVEAGPAVVEIGAGDPDGISLSVGVHQEDAVTGAGGGGREGEPAAVGRPGGAGY